MPLAQVKGLSGYLSMEQKQELIRKVTDAIVSVEGEGLRSVPGSLLKKSPQASGASVAHPSRQTL
jgi:4-oxalocrotonate tautomerase